MGRRSKASSRNPARTLRSREAHQSTRWQSILDQTVNWVPRLGGFVLPLIFFWTTYDRFVLPKLIAAHLLLVVLIAASAVRLVHKGTWTRSALDLPLVGLAASALLSTIFAVNHNVALFGTYARYEGVLTILTYLAIFWLTLQAVQKGEDARAIMRSLLGAAYLIAVIAVLQSLFGSATGPDTGFNLGGILRAYATFGNPNALGAFLAMLLPFALHEVLSARSLSSRLLALNLSVTIAMALLLTFSRSAWAGAAFGLAVVVGSRVTSHHRTMLALGAGILLLGLPFVGSAIPTRLSPLTQSTLTRAVSVTDPTGGSGSTRLHIWQDSLALIASRPVLGYGPDTFGLVYPAFQRGQWTPGFLIDRAHSEVLQIAATQGIVGLAAYGWLLISFVRSFWTGSRTPESVAAFGGWLAYQFTIQLNFSFLPASAPYWIFAAAGVRLWAQAPAAADFPVRARASRVWISAGLAVALVALALPILWRPYAADARFLAAVSSERRGDRAGAAKAVGEARAMDPSESVYAVAAGHLALRLTSDGSPGAGAEWLAARDAYLDAARLGTFTAAAFRYLALSELELGRRPEAIVAARKAVELDRFDRANRELLARLTTS